MACGSPLCARVPTDGLLYLVANVRVPALLTAVYCTLALGLQLVNRDMQLTGGFQHPIVIAGEFDFLSLSRTKSTRSLYFRTLLLS
jgi:hypothetical protein